MNDNAVRIKEILVSRGETLATAESCTSGRIAAELTKAPGASGYFQGSLVAYQDRVKTEFLGVPQEVIAECDVVSREVVEQMVRGVCSMLGTDYAIASTGYADKDGSERVAGGTIWIAWGHKDDVHSKCLTTNIDRETNTQNAVEEALACFCQYLSSAESK